MSLANKKSLTAELVKELEDKYREVQEAVVFIDDYDMRMLAIAKTNIEQGLMWLKAATK